MGSILGCWRMMGRNDDSAQKHIWCPFFEGAFFIELTEPIGVFFYNIYNSIIFRILYFIPFAILKTISLIIEWYYETFMINENILTSAGSRVIFVYIVPIVTILILAILLSLYEGMGWRILFLSPILFIFFPFIVAIYGGMYITNFKHRHVKALDRKQDRIENRLYKIRAGFEKEDLNTDLRVCLFFKHVSRKIRGYNRTLTNLRIPNPGNPEEIIKVGALIINQYGVAVWSVPHSYSYYFYGKQDSNMWLHSDVMEARSIENHLITKGNVPHKYIQTMNNPLRENRQKVNIIQKMIRDNGFQNAHMFSGVAFYYMDTDNSMVESGADEKVCNPTYIPSITRVWHKMSKSRLSRREIKGIAELFAKYQVWPEQENYLLIQQQEQLKQQALENAVKKL